MKLLDLFCGAGGAAMGYHRAGFEVTGVDNKPQKRYPFKFIQADALEYLATNGHDFDAIHASPPCGRFSPQTAVEYRKNHPDLIASTRELLLETNKPYVIENVTGARKKLINPIKLCGSMFGLCVFRHRWFEIVPHILLVPECRHTFTPVYVTGSTGRAGCEFRRRDATIAKKRKAMDIDWMVTSEIDQAIPPAYTEWIGRRIMKVAAQL